MEFFIDSHLSKDMLVQRLNSFEDEGSETYLNPIRDANAVSVKDRSYLLGFVMNFIETKDSDKVYFVSLSWECESGRARTGGGKSKTDSPQFLRGIFFFFFCR